MRRQSNDTLIRLALEEGMYKLMGTLSLQGMVHAEPLLKGETVAQAIQRYADSSNARLIAMDSRGHGAIRHALLGSVAMAVLAHSTRPVMMTGPAVGEVNQNERYTIVATTDCSPASEQVLSSLKDLLAFPLVSVFLTNVYVPALGDRGEQAELQARYDLLTKIQDRLLSDTKCELVVRRAQDLTQPESLVLDTAHELQASAIAMSTKGHSAQRHVVIGSFAAAVLGRSSLPLILVRA